MLSHEPLNRSGITSRAGIPKDVMTFWTRRGLMRPIEAANGTGNHLRFHWYEANIAALMNQLRLVGVPIEGLIAIANTFRDAIAWFGQYQLSHNDVFVLEPVFDASDSKPVNRIDDEELARDLFSWGWTKHSDIAARAWLNDVQMTLPRAGYRVHVEAFLIIMDQPNEGERRAQSLPNVTYFWRVGDVWKFSRGENAPEEARNDGALATIAVDVDTVIYDVWNRP